MKFILIYVTHKNLKEAKKVAEHLLKKRLIACANFVPIESSYLWKGKIESGKEVVSLLKTKKENWLKVKKEVEKIHPYDIPCIIKLEVESNNPFAQWIKRETK
jgi:periplasmic divalent cation tolerance protein